MTPERSIELVERYRKAMHAMQAGVALLLGRDPNVPACQPKHLRVGINSAMVEHGALAKLLIDKGIIDEEAYMVSLCEFAEAERDTYVELCREALGMRPDQKLDLV